MNTHGPSKKFLNGSPRRKILPCDGCSFNARYFSTRMRESVYTYMKKGPNLRWSLIQCSGGDEGDRTPDLLTASQALSQLSYAPVRKSTIRELGRRCKDNFRKTFAGAARDGGGEPSARARGLGIRPDRPPDPPGGNKTMPDYGARHAVPEHTGIRDNKTAGRRLANFQIEGV